VKYAEVVDLEDKWWLSEWTSQRRLTMDIDAGLYADLLGKEFSS
jgi:hypothetical protein